MVVISSWTGITFANSRAAFNDSTSEAKDINDDICADPDSQRVSGARQCNIPYQNPTRSICQVHCQLLPLAWKVCCNLRQ
jgi:hypothetical protein